MPSKGGGLDHSPGRLPRQLTSFIGREAELGELTALLERSRLLTLTGPGGSGKTRLGLQLAEAVAGGFPDGVFFVALAPVGGPELVLSSIAQAVGLLEAEHQNIRAALDWYTRHEPRDALRLAAAMSRFWGVRGHFTEGRERLAALLGDVADPTPTRVRALNGAASLAIDQGDYAVARDVLGESIRLSQELGDRHGEAMGLTYLARSLIADSRPAEAEPYVDRALQLLDGQGDAAALATTLLYAGLAAQFSGRAEEACTRHERCVEVADMAGFRSVRARSLQMLGHARLELGDIRGARGALEEALPTCLELGDRWVVPLVIAGFAEVAACTGRPRRALRLAGAARGLCQAGQFSMPAVAQARLERWLAPAGKQLASAAGQVAAEGERMSLAEAVSYALADEPEDTWRGGPRRTLTRRELEVAALVARGLTNRSIAGQLYLSVRTVDTHVDHVLTKLGFSNRSQLVAWAYESGLARSDGE